MGSKTKESTLYTLSAGMGHLMGKIRNLDSYPDSFGVNPTTNQWWEAIKTIMEIK